MTQTRNLFLDNVWKNLMIYTAAAAATNFIRICLHIYRNNFVCDK